MAFSTLKSIRQKFATGKGFIMPIVTAEMLSGGTQSNAGSGQISPRPFAEEGSTYPGTLNTVFLPEVSGSKNFLIQSLIGNQIENAGWLCRFYLMGTVALTSTGSQFTASSATFPVTRTVMGVANTAIPLLPFIYITTGTTSPAFAVRLQTGAGGAGYVDEAGNSIVGDVTITAPNATMVAGSAVPLFQNRQSPMVTRILDIRVDTAASNGAGQVWGAELLMPFGSFAPQVATFKDGLYGGLCLPELTAAVPTSGSLTSFLGCIGLHSVGNQRQHGYVAGIVD